MIRYFDASALVKRYVEEDGSDLVAQLLCKNGSATSRLTHVEILSAAASRLRQGEISPEDHQRIATALSRDMEGLIVVEMTGEVVSVCERLLSRYGLRAGDAVQVASCIVLGERAEVPVEFVAFDLRCNQAARGEGLDVIGP